MIYSEHKYTIVDMDGTLSDHTHRAHLFVAGQWDEYHSLAPIDNPIDNVCKLVRVMARVSRIIILTGREVKYTQPTYDWLSKHDLATSVHDIIMRPSNNYAKDPDFKIAALDVYFGGREEMLSKVWMVIDDRDKIVEAMRNIGLTVLQPCAGAY